LNELLVEADKIDSPEHVEYMKSEQNGSLTIVKIKDPYKEAVLKEAYDVLFVLLHLIKQTGGTPMEGLSYTITKMVNRVNDPEYVGRIKE
jgi:hypothetical protein